MRGKAVVIFIAAISLLAARAAPHDDGDHHLPPAAAPTVPANGTPDSGNPKLDYSTTVEEHGDMDMGDFGMGEKEGMDGADMDGMDMDGMGHDHPAHKHNSSVSAPISPDQMSYWLWPEHRGLLYAHISIMIVSWGFLLPVGTCPSFPFQQHVI
jgi:hypothetical protein